MSYGSLWPTYAKEWDGMQRTRLSMASAAAEKIMANKARYVAAADLFAKAHPGSDLPWYFIAPIHYREADFNFNAQLAQGDPLGQVSTHVPAGEGPYTGADAWERSVVIALEDRKLQALSDWRLEKLLYEWEEYNGEGYRNHGVPSAYVWAGTNIYTGGMYVSDGVWSSTTVDPRVGCAPILKCLMELDATIQPARETPPGVEPIPKPVPTPIPTEPPVTTLPVPAPTPGQFNPADLTNFLTTATAVLQKMQQQPQQQAPPPPTTGANPMGAVLAGFGTWFISVLPQISLALLPVIQGLVAGGVMGPVVGAAATPTGQTVGATLLSTFGIGIANWIKTALTTKWATPTPPSAAGKA